MILNRVILGTENKEKCATIKKILKKHKVKYAEILCVPSDSGVDGSPENEETLLGAKNRVKNSIKKYKPKLKDMFIGMESGLFKLYDDKWYEKCITYVVYYDDLKKPKKVAAGSEEYPLCELLQKTLNAKKRHRVGMEKLRKLKSVEPGVKDTFSIYTNGVKQRAVTFEQSYENCILKLLNYNA